MVQEITALLWKEWRELLAQPGSWLSSGGWRSNLVAALVAGVHTGVFLPRLSSTAMAAAFTGLAGSILVLIQAGDSFAGERERHTLEALLSTEVSGTSMYLGKTISVVLHGWVLGTAALFANVVTTVLKGEDIANGSMPIGSLATAALVALPLVFLAGLVGVLVSVRSATVKQAHQRIVSIILAVLVTPSLLFAAVLAVVPRRGEPPAWLSEFVEWLLPMLESGSSEWLAAGVALVVLMNVALLWLGRGSFERDRMTSI